MKKSSTIQEINPSEEAPKAKKITNADLLKSILSKRDAGKALYQAADAELDALLRRTKVGVKITHPETGEVWELIDNFESSNKVFRAHGIARFELKAVKGTKRTKE